MPGQPDLAHQALERGSLFLPSSAALDREREVGPLEAGDQLQRAVQPELVGDVGPDLRRGGGGESGRGDAELGAEPGEPAIVRPEIVAPLADAVRLVDHQAGRRRPAPAPRGSPPWPSRSGAT